MTQRPRQVAERAETTTTNKMATHPLADWFPVLTQTELKELAEDIRLNGLTNPITTCEGKILDGRNRYMACGMAGVEPRFEEWDGNGSPVRFVWSRNYARRHLTPGQRASVALEFNKMLKKEGQSENRRDRRGGTLTHPANVANLPPTQGDAHGEPDPDPNSVDAPEGSGRTRDRLAELAGVSPRLIQNAKTVMSRSPEAYQQVREGAISINQAMEQIKQASASGNGGNDRKGTQGRPNPVSRVIQLASSLEKASKALVTTLPLDIQNPKDFSRAVNSLGLAFAHLVTVLAKYGDADGTEQARKIIAHLASFSRTPNPNGRTLAQTQTDKKVNLEKRPNEG